MNSGGLPKQTANDGDCPGPTIYANAPKKRRVCEKNSPHIGNSSPARKKTDRYAPFPYSSPVIRH